MIMLIERVVNSTSSPPKDGYSLRVCGLRNGQFVTLHTIALTCIFISLLSVVFILISSFTHQSVRTFFNWSKTERFVVYLAACIAIFNTLHSISHLHVLITRNHVYPRALCEFYAFTILWVVAAQFLIVHIICINGFVLIWHKKKLQFGVYDWKLTSCVFGVPFIISIAALSTEVLGPTGA